MGSNHRFGWVSVALAMIVSLAGCGGGGGGGSEGSSPVPSPGASAPSPAPTTKFSTHIESESDAASFLMHSSFGGSMTEIRALQNRDAAEWLYIEMAKPRTEYVQPLLTRQQNGEELRGDAPTYMVWDNMIKADDQLRQRMTFALSQIFVISDKSPGGEPLQVAYYIDNLSKNAFGNFRDLMEDVTYTPHMAKYLTYFKNRKGNPDTGRMPDENYAREFLQLFTTGLIELNMDGTAKTGSDGQPIELFDNEDITGLAKVFTGFALAGSNFRDSDANADAKYTRLEIFEDKHSQLAKTFLGLTIPAGTGGQQSVDMALDHIFAHPNVAPFVSRQLIQRFTSSDPSPAYVERVATAFERGEFVSPNGRRFGTGERGDLSATLAAILLDESLYGADRALNADGGKIREPILRFVHWARAFDVQNIDSYNEHRLLDTRSPSNKLGQHPYRSPSVFNFYRPGFIAPGAESGEQGRTTPEFQIVNEGSMIGYTNFLTDYIFNRSGGRLADFDSFLPDYSNEVPLADNPQALVDHLDMLMTANRMSPDRKAEIVSIVDGMDLRSDDNQEEDKLRRVRVAVLLTATTPAYVVQQ